jgi:large subunit ribosomal protein L20
MLKSLSYSYRHRRERKRDMRRLWILRISAAARQEGLSYSRLIHLLREKRVDINRKVLADIAVSDPSTFSRIIHGAQED